MLKILATLALVSTIALAAGSSATIVAFDDVWFVNGPAGGDVANDMVVDSNDFVFIAGQHSGIDLNGDGHFEAEADRVDPLFIRLDPAERSSWVKGLRAPGFDMATGVAPANDGGAIGVGVFREVLTAPDGPSVSGRGDMDGFVVRIRPDGSVDWLQAIGAEGHDRVASVVTDREANAFVAGQTVGSFAVGAGGTRVRASEGGSAMLLASYDGRGRLRWAVSGTTTGSASARIVAQAPGGDIIVIGTSDGDLDFDGDAEVDLALATAPGGFLARFSDSGQYVSGWSLSGPSDLSPQELEFDPAGRMLLAGTIRGQGGDLDGDGRHDVRLRSGAESSAFLARFDRTGELLWARSYPMDGAYDVATRGTSIVLSGFYRGSVDLDQDGDPEPSDPDPERESEIGVLDIREDGSVQKAWTAVGPGNDQARAAVLMNNSDRLTVTGFVQLTADFTGDGEESGWIRCDALGDIFIANYSLEEEEPIVLRGTGREAEGEIIGELTWTGIPGEDVDVYRNGELVVTVPNDGAYSHTVPRGTSGPFVYRVCEARSSRCSADVPLAFR